jgi:hypothetical protein
VEGIGKQNKINKIKKIKDIIVKKGTNMDRKAKGKG